MTPCQTPGCTGKAVVKGECRACYMWRRRHGESREAQLVRQAGRDFERQQLRRIARGIVLAGEQGQ